MFQFVLAAVLCGAPFLAAQDCSELDARVAATYTFQPSALDKDQKDAAAAAMTEFWDFVLADPAAHAPCLRAALLRDDADAWFRFDGSALLVEADPSEASKQLQVDLWSKAAFADVNQRYWLETLTRLGAEGLDVSAAAERWMREGGDGFTVPEHGMFQVNDALGALFLFGSMDEAHATPALTRLAQHTDEPWHPMVFSLLVLQATPGSWRAVDTLDTTGWPEEGAQAVQMLRSEPIPFPEDDPSVTLTRDALLADLHAQLGDAGGERLATPVSPYDWVVNAARELQPDDLALLRRARRASMTVSSDEAPNRYMQYSAVLQQLTWSEELFTEGAAPEDG